jgi:hypothetical protein
MLFRIEQMQASAQPVHPIAKRGWRRDHHQSLRLQEREDLNQKAFGLAQMLQHGDQRHHVEAKVSQG